MENKTSEECYKIPNWLLIISTVALVLGIFLRFYHLEQKVYSFDETFSSTYIYGQHSQAYQNFDNSILSIGELQKYLFIDANKTLIQSVEQVIEKLYVFPPIYPVLTILWSYLFNHWFDNGLVIQRSLAALLSVIAIWGIYWLGLELFASKTTAFVAAVIVAISPFHLQYAQIIRPYSILIATTVIACGYLLKAIRFNNLFWWLIYGLSLVIGLYSNLLFALVLVAHTLYVLINENLRNLKSLTAYFLTLGISTLAFLPWLWAFINSSMLKYSVEQVSDKSSLFGLINAWLKGIQNLFIDLYHPFFSPNFLKAAQYFFAPIILAIAAISLYTLCRYAPRKIRNFLLALAIATGVSLMVKDVISGSSITTRMRYLIPFVLAMELIAAYLIGSWLTASQSSHRRWGQFALSILILCGVSSCLVISAAPSWNAFGSPHFPKESAIISSADHPLVLCTNLDRALSMSYLVDSDTKFKLIRDDLTIPDGFNRVFVLEASAKTLKQLAAKHKLVNTFPQGRLFEIAGVVRSPTS
ncbi:MULTISPECIES: glycosyltransferase family 39 protein [Nostocaceae]|nr:MULTISPECIES: glycosyltransferase family 39 protein [Nostocaceae]MBC1256529.1 glycosyltransferase family 39 protein [Trichormus variabilis V5]MBC1265459.1 glycosyltransferase family 39 protein [Trichormus variabilis FSR]MBC1304679.1 glycosyltransferase family 39 protein [Trichormus variabilis N2B]MBC1313465.1 glycosyltransferase family 39 protein [Trichormus variabilis PNB]MBC1328945.1 glycosyltransferase family 39 protein [Trichormus variabilis 9RC]